MRKHFPLRLDDRTRDCVGKWIRLVYPETKATAICSTNGKKGIEQCIFNHESCRKAICLWTQEAIINCKEWKREQHSFDRCVCVFDVCKEPMCVCMIHMGCPLALFCAVLHTVAVFGRYTTNNEKRKKKCPKKYDIQKKKNRNRWGIIADEEVCQLQQTTCKKKPKSRTKTEREMEKNGDGMRAHILNRLIAFELKIAENYASIWCDKCVPVHSSDARIVKCVYVAISTHFDILRTYTAAANDTFSNCNS